MMWVDIVSIVFVCVTMNHLGLVSAVIGVFFRKRVTLPVISCPKCLTFWATLAYCCGRTATHSTAGEAAGTTAIMVLAISFLASYSAIWLELLEGYVDTLYMKCYEKIYPNATDNTLTAADFDDDPAGSVSDMR